MKTTAAKPMSQIERYILLTFGVLLTAVGVYFFKFPNNFSTGGVSGLSLILGRVFPSPVLTPSAFVFIINMALLVVGGIASATHLSHVDRMMAVLAHPTAGIFLEALLLGLLAVCIAVYALLVKREASSGARKALAATGIVLAVAFAFACGVSYMMTSRPVWNTVALPLAYLGTALATGAALYLVMCAALKVDEGDVKKAGVYAAAGGALSLVLTVAFGLVSGTAFGDQAALFWVAVVLCGSAAPAVCGVLVARKSGGALSLGVVALAGALVGSVAVRAVMWLVGTAVANYFGFAL